jgi:phosphate starvation-inducible PhoH-like protein
MRKNRPKNQRVVKTKKQVEQEKRNTLKPVEGVTENHKTYIKSILDNDVTICFGPSGAGKSYISSGLFAHMLHSGKYHQIIATRPLVAAGKDIGATPGEVKDKIAPYLKALEEHLKFFLGRVNYGLYFNDNQIRYEPLELMRGATFSNSLMILDEAQNCTLEQIKMFITRMGQNSKVIVNGDIKQTDIRDKSGLSIAVNKLALIKGVGVCKLTRDDIQRNGIIAEVLRALED